VSSERVVYASASASAAGTVDYAPESAPQPVVFDGTGTSPGALYYDQPQPARAMLPMAPVTKPPQLLPRDLSDRQPQLQLGGSGTTLGDMHRDPPADSTFAALGDVWPPAARR